MLVALTAIKTVTEPTTSLQLLQGRELDTDRRTPARRLRNIGAAP